MTRDWRTGLIELMDGYTLIGYDGHHTDRVDDVRFAIEGGFVHIQLPGARHIQIVSAPAVRLISYTD
jgi:hypothetical protein